MDQDVMRMTSVKFFYLYNFIQMKWYFCEKKAIDYVAT